MPASDRLGNDEILRRMECAWSEQCGACLNVVNAALPDVLAENARLTALLAERDAEVARLKLTTRSDREYAEMKQRAEEAEGQIARLVRAGEALTAKSPCFVTIRPGGNDIECCQFCLTDNGHDPLCEWVGLVAALAARGNQR